MSRSRRLLTILAVLAVAVAVAPVASATSPGLTPESVDEVVFPGQYIDIRKTVSTPEIPPSVDVCLLEDETGSFADDIGNLQAAAGDIYDDVVAGAPDAQFAVAGFRDYPVSPYGAAGDWVYRLLSTMDPTKAAWLAGVGLLSASGGSDAPEAQYDAIVAAAGPGPTDYVDRLGPQGDCGWRDDATVTRVLVVTTDAPFHGPDGTHLNGLASTTTALTAAGVVVIGLKAPGAGAELDSLASATGGSVQALSSDGSNIAAAILAGLGDIDIDVSMTSDCAWPISTTFFPASATVTSGDDAVFRERISVAADAPGGTYTCRDWALIDGSPMVDASGAIIYETKTISVPDGFLTGGGQIGKGKKAQNFGGNVGFLVDASVVGQWQFRDGDLQLNMHSLSIDTLQFSVDAGDPPDPPVADATVATFSGTARVKLGTDKWMDSCTFVAQAHDHGEPAVADVFGIHIDCGPGGVWTFGRELLDTGNLQIHDGLKG